MGFKTVNRGSHASFTNHVGFTKFLNSLTFSCHINAYNSTNTFLRGYNYLLILIICILNIKCRVFVIFQEGKDCASVQRLCDDIIFRDIPREF